MQLIWFVYILIFNVEIWFFICFNFSLDDYDGECILVVWNYVGFGFVFQFYIGLDNGKGMVFIKYY